MTKNVRVRFAPSPTGPLHIGGVRTALFNYLFAKKHKGTFILRVEDTDQNRYVDGAEDYIEDALRWLSIPYDEGPKHEGGFGPYRQSERKHIYKQYAEKLIDEGKAYYAFDTNSQLNEHRKDHERKGKTFIYNWHNRTKGRLVNALVLSDKAIKKKIEQGDSYVVRFKSPKDKTLLLQDLIRGDIEIDSNILDDKIIFKSDGMPTYHLANVVDDHLMQVSHVIRGEEWLPSLALHYLLYDALDWDKPQFAHLPLIMNPTGKGKLSKRHGVKLGIPVFPIEWNNIETNETYKGFREEGYYPEAVINFLAFLGWNPGTEDEFFNLSQLIKSFSLKAVNKSGARFDPEKTKWYNHHYMQLCTNKELTKAFKRSNSELNNIDNDYIEMVVALIKERATFVSQFWELSHYFFEAPKLYNKKALEKALSKDTKKIMLDLIEILKPIEVFTKEVIQKSIKQWITKGEYGFGKVIMPLRLALVGDLKGVDVFDILFMIGKEEAIKRITSFVAL